MTTPWWTDDQDLLAALDCALAEERAVPERFVEAGKAAYTWHTVDAELAALTYDSAAQPVDRLARTRDESAPLRALTFTASRLRIQIDVTGDALHGQIIPEQPAEIEVRTEADRRHLEADEVGWFAIRPIPTGPFQLHCRTASGATVLTTSIALSPQPEGTR